jgi:photosystem I subunit 8
MAAAFLPSILVPLVGLIFPAFSMALFFLYTQMEEDIA